MEANPSMCSQLRAGTAARLYPASSALASAISKSITKMIAGG